jgi:hypothetical protein
MSALFSQILRPSWGVKPGCVGGGIAALRSRVLQLVPATWDSGQVLAVVFLVAAFACLGIAAWWTIKNPRQL